MCRYVMNPSGLWRITTSIAIVRDLATYPTATDAVLAHVDAEQLPRYEQALATLVPSEIIRGR